MISCVKTDVGRVRLNNEDAFYIPPKAVDLPSLFIVADGMGGHDGGEIASNIAVKEISGHINLRLKANFTGKQVRLVLKESMIKANSAFLTETSKNIQLKDGNYGYSALLYNAGYILVI